MMKYIYDKDTQLLIDHINLKKEKIIVYYREVAKNNPLHPKIVRDIKHRMFRDLEPLNKQLEKIYELSVPAISCEGLPEAVARQRLNR